jgi:hypothetical protein
MYAAAPVALEPLVSVMLLADTGALTLKILDNALPLMVCPDPSIERFLLRTNSPCCSVIVLPARVGAKVIVSLLPNVPAVVHGSEAPNIAALIAAIASRSEHPVGVRASPLSLTVMVTA